MLGVFVGVCAYVGDIAGDVRLFQAAYALGFAGYGLLVYCVWRGRPAGRWGLWLAGCIVARMALLHVTPGDDVYRYLWEGRIQTYGWNPFAIAPDDPALVELRDDNWRHINHPDYPAIYPPLAQLEFYAITTISPTIHSIKAVHVLFDVVAVMLLAAWLRREGKQPHWAVVYGLCPLTLAAFGIEGHVDSLMVASLAGAGLADAHRRPYLCAGLVAAAILVKLVPVVLLPWLAWKNRRAALLCVALVVAGYAPYADAGGVLFASLWRFTADTQLLGLGHGLLCAVLDGRMSRGIGALIVLSVALWHAWRGASLAVYMLSVFGVLIVFMPVVHFWYLTWVLTAVALAPRVSWMVLAACMVFYFEAAWHRATTGDWRMPTWVAYGVYAPFLGTWLVEKRIVSRFRRIRSA